MGGDEYEGYDEYVENEKNYDYFELYEQILSGTVPYTSPEGESYKLGLNPRVWQYVKCTDVLVGQYTIYNKADEAYLGVTEDGEKKPYSTVPEVVELFNTSMNRVKKEAVKVTKNYEKRTVNQLELPSALQSMGDILINEVMKDDTEPIIYATKQEIRDNFMVPNQDYVSCLKVEDVEKVAFKDTGSEYEIYILVKDEKGPTAGSGVGSVFDVIETNEMAEKAPSFVKNFTTEYYNCVVKVKIDKQSGRVTHANYSTPLYMDSTVDFMGTHRVIFGVTFEKDYTIEY
jgi:hypothetical protein